MLCTLEDERHCLNAMKGNIRLKCCSFVLNSKIIIALLHHKLADLIHCFKVAALSNIPNIVQKCSSRTGTFPSEFATSGSF